MSKGLVGTGALFRPERPAEELPAFARTVESLGYDSLWIVEDCFLAGGLTMAASALAATETIGVGVGLLPAGLRNPALAAMEIAALARLHPGRFSVAFGHGVEAWMRQAGARPRDRIVLLEETVDAVKRLLAGERLQVTGEHVRLDDVALDQAPPSPPPILVGTTGPKGLAVAGRTADGVLLPEGSSPAAVRWARERAAAAGSAGRTTVYAWLSVAEDSGAALRAIRPVVDEWRRRGLYSGLAGLAGLAPGDVALDEEHVRRVAVAGDASDCDRAVRDLQQAGAANVVLVPPVDRDAAQLERFSSSVMPLLRGDAG